MHVERIACALSKLVHTGGPSAVVTADATLRKGKTCNIYIGPVGMVRKAPEMKKRRVLKRIKD